MPFSKVEKRLLAEIFADSDLRLNNRALQKRLVEALGEDAFWADLLAATWEERLLSEIMAAKEVWFSALGWWLAVLLMWGSVIVVALCYLFLGALPVEPLTWGLIGAACYYVIVQILTPWRLRRERVSLERTLKSRKNSTEKIIESLL